MVQLMRQNKWTKINAISQEDTDFQENNTELTMSLVLTETSSSKVHHYHIVIAFNSCQVIINYNSYWYKIHEKIIITNLKLTTIREIVINLAVRGRIARVL